tara:strand:+ start:294 stop:554 length:261 start_codon:yes stop_codon:yes gene_type:complete
MVRLPALGAAANVGLAGYTGLEIGDAINRSTPAPGRNLDYTDIVNLDLNPSELAGGLEQTADYLSPLVDPSAYEAVWDSMWSDDDE